MDMYEINYYHILLVTENFHSQTANEEGLITHQLVTISIYIIHMK